MVWSDPGKAFTAMTSGEEGALLNAVENGDLKIEGDLALAQRFGDLVRLMKKPQGSAPTKKQEKVAVIGLGKMGAGLAKNILESGFDLIAFNRTAAKSESFVKDGAKLARSPQEASDLADIVITSLMDDASVRNAVIGEKGILAGMKPGGIHLCATTISPALAKELTQLHASQGSKFVAGPVVGRPDVSDAGELLTFIAGSIESVARCKPVCAAYSSVTIVIGEEPCLANYAKLAANYFAVSNIELMGQLYTFGDRVGIGGKLFAQLFDASFSNPTLKMYSKKILTRDFDTNVGFELSGGIKDIKLMKDASDVTSSSFCYASIIQEKMQKAMDLGWSRRDWSAFVDITRMSALEGLDEF